jgi:hypothetical protein
VLLDRGHTSPRFSIILKRDPSRQHHEPVRDEPVDQDGWRRLGHGYPDAGESGDEGRLDRAQTARAWADALATTEAPM